MLTILFARRRAKRQAEADAKMAAEWAAARHPEGAEAVTEELCAEMARHRALHKDSKLNPS